MEPQNGVGVTKKRNGTASKRAAPAQQRAEAARAAVGDIDGPSRLARIAERAYFIYEQRGRQGGQDVEHWLQAERELRLAPADAGHTDDGRTQAGLANGIEPGRRASRKRELTR